jgi:hypothetical protein
MKFGADVSDRFLNGTALDLAFENFARATVYHPGPFGFRVAMSFRIKADDQFAREKGPFIVRQRERFGGDFFCGNAHQWKK